MKKFSIFEESIDLFNSLEKKGVLESFKCIQSKPLDPLKEN